MKAENYAKLNTEQKQAVRDSLELLDTLNGLSPESAEFLKELRLEEDEENK